MIDNGGRVCWVSLPTLLAVRSSSLFPHCTPLSFSGGPEPLLSLFPGFCSNVMAMYHAVGVSPKAKFDLVSLGTELLRAKLLSPPTPPPLKPLIVENDNTDSGGSGKARTITPKIARCGTRSVVFHEALAIRA